MFTLKGRTGHLGRPHAVRKMPVWSTCIRLYFRPALNWRNSRIWKNNQRRKKTVLSGQAEIMRWGLKRFLCTTATWDHKNLDAFYLLPFRAKKNSSQTLSFRRNHVSNEMSDNNADQFEHKTFDIWQGVVGSNFVPFLIVF